MVDSILVGLRRWCRACIGRKEFQLASYEEFLILDKMNRLSEESSKLIVISLPRGVKPDFICHVAKMLNSKHPGREAIISLEGAIYRQEKLKGLR